MAETVETPILTKVRILETFIVRVGVPTLIVLVLIGVTIGSLLGYIDPPMVTKSAFDTHMLTNDQIHSAMIKNSTANTEALQQITAELRELRLGMKCDRKPNDREKLRCYQELNGASD